MAAVMIAATRVTVACGGGGGGCSGRRGRRTQKGQHRSPPSMTPSQPKGAVMRAQEGGWGSPPASRPRLRHTPSACRAVAHGHPGPPDALILPVSCKLVTQHQAACTQRRTKGRKGARVGRCDMGRLREALGRARGGQGGWVDGSRTLNWASSRRLADEVRFQVPGSGSRFMLMFSHCQYPGIVQVHGPGSRSKVQVEDSG